MARKHTLKDYSNLSKAIRHQNQNSSQEDFGGSSFSEDIINNSSFRNFKEPIHKEITLIQSARGDLWQYDVKNVQGGGALDTYETKHKEERSKLIKANSHCNINFAKSEEP